MSMWQHTSKIWSKLAITTVLFFLIAGCSSVKTVYDVTQGVMPANIDPQRAQELISTALYSKGWTVNRKETGKIFASHTRRKHFASIRIDYNDKTFSITRLNSRNLDYDEQDNTIHRNYNNWILLLEQKIRFYLSNH